ncbi:hypothetical protein NDU88_000093 [Pleurodeles waltl]|uniref:Uncharacterized protein n=1 Tax=Pleurodeles waltl TaxID=8319 RepID=A0AAV7S496_PLEWA|nr:hypothetical protein NDU88_000093 [Pleurodeles waltl]
MEETRRRGAVLLQPTRRDLLAMGRPSGVGVSSSFLDGSPKMRETMRICTGEMRYRYGLRRAQLQLRGTASRLEVPTRNAAKAFGDCRRLNVQVTDIFSQS